MKLYRLIATALTTLALLSPILQTTAYAATSARAPKIINNNAIQTVTFTNTQFLETAERLYREGQISEKDYQSIQAAMMERWTIRGVNKLVYVGNSQYDLYLNNVLSSMVVAANFYAVSHIIASIPAVASFLASNGLASGALNTIVSAGAWAALDPSNGMIFRLWHTPISGVITTIGVRSQ